MATEPNEPLTCERPKCEFRKKDPSEPLTCKRPKCEFSMEPKEVLTPKKWRDFYYRGPCLIGLLVVVVGVLLFAWPLWLQSYWGWRGRFLSDGTRTHGDDWLQILAVYCFALAAGPLVIHPISVGLAFLFKMPIREHPQQALLPPT